MPERKEPNVKSAKKKEDVDFQIAFYEGVLKCAPHFIEALAAVGDLYTKTGYLQKGLDADLRLASLRQDDPIVFYNLACSHALLNQTRFALAALSKAIEFGYDDFAYLKKDPDLENLLKDEQVQAFIKELERKKKSSKL